MQLNFTKRFKQTGTNFDDIKNFEKFTYEGREYIKIPPIVDKYRITYTAFDIESASPKIFTKNYIVNEKKSFVFKLEDLKVGDFWMVEAYGNEHDFHTVTEITNSHITSKILNEPRKGRTVTIPRDSKYMDILIFDIDSFQK